jgi:hypothetical protein
MAIDVALDPLGRVWVADYQANQITVFDEDGTFVRTVGQKGGGPGEFAGPAGVSRGPRGHMWAMDSRNSRISEFDTAGNLVSEHRFESAMRFIPCQCGFHGGQFWTQPVLATQPQTPEDLETGVALLLEDSALAPLDTLALPRRPGGPAIFTHVVGNGGMTTVPIPFAPQAGWAAARGGTLWVSYGTPYRLLEVSPAGDTLREVDRAFEPPPVTGAERDSALHRLDAFVKRGGKIDAGKIPDHKPAIERFFVDQAGYLWVLPFRPAGAEMAWNVFDPRGVYLGALRLPVQLAASSSVVTRDRIVTLTRDDLGVQYVVVLALDRGSKSPPR